MRETTVTGRPKVVTLCGSVRFWPEWQAAYERESRAGRIVLTVSCIHDTCCNAKFHDSTDEFKLRLDDLHKRRIDLSDEILVLDVDGYIGDSTRSEVDYARANGKRVRWLTLERP